MSRTFEEVRDEAMVLSPEERGHLAEELFDSVESEEDIQWDDEYEAELQRRIAGIDAGTAETIDSDEAIANAQRLLDDLRNLRAKSSR
jgi:putative addiction module component (TIGR02574 family)